MIERTARVAAPAALALFVVIGTVQSQRPAAIALVAGAVALLVGFVIAWRNLSGWALVAALAVAAAALVVICHTQASNLGWFGLCVIAGWAAIGAPGVPTIAMGAALIGAFVGEMMVLPDEPGWGAWTAGVVFTVTACAFSRRQHELVDQLREAQAGLAERTRAEERNRIAAEMHDVIGHALTVSLLHVSSARLSLDEDTATARAALTEAERVTTESLDEVRAAVGLMRAADPTGVAPMPSGVDVTELVESFRRTRTAVELDVRGDLESLGAARGLAVYRIVQEALTNAARHGDGSPVTVRVQVEDHDTIVTVLNGGPSPAKVVEGSGLMGMRERAESLGGQLLAGPSPEGWRVEAVLPS
ncbi:MAG: histidine kinase [Actinomycetia bacterium]|nr:histidine kinase [Actinomycetes bacterium]